MTTGIGILIICLASMCISWLLFGRAERSGMMAKFMYWLKSTLVTSAALVFWLWYREPEVGFVYLVLFSLTFGGFMNLCRS